jgi:hypothetical protein
MKKKTGLEELAALMAMMELEKVAAPKSVKDEPDVRTIWTPPPARP